MIRLLSIAAFAAAGLAGTAHAQQEPRPPLHTTIPMASINLPDEFAPAVIPYLMCMSSRFGETSYGSGGHGSGGLKKADIAAATAVALEKCAGVRREAFANGVRMLETQKLGTSAEREARVEATLREIETMFSNIGNSFPPEPDAGPSGSR